MDGDALPCVQTAKDIVALTCAPMAGAGYGAGGVAGLQAGEPVEALPSARWVVHHGQPLPQQHIQSGAGARLRPAGALPQPASGEEALALRRKVEGQGCKG